MANILLGSFVVLAALWLFVRSQRHHSRPLPLPPGPKGNWLRGNDIPHTSNFAAYERLFKAYGPVITLKRGLSQIIIVIGRHEAAVEIMERAGVRVADRPALVPTDAVSGGMRMLFMHYGERFRRFRRAFHTHLSTKAIPNYYPFITQHSLNLLRDVMRDPDNHQVHTKTMSCSMILSITYGRTTRALPSDPEVQAIQKVLWRIGQIVRPGSYLVEIFPFLRFVPAYMHKFTIWHKEELALFQSQIATVKAAMAIGKEEASFAKDLLTQQDALGLTDDEVAYLAGSMFGAGSDSTAAALSVALLAAATHPREQAVVYEEIARVVGPSTFPTFQDIVRLPQLTAFILESYRWRPVSAGTPHRATADIIWNEYCIPANSIVIGNHWSITRDTAYFPDPDIFRPSRWLDAADDFTVFTFGFGRRICPGQHLAHSTVLLNAALLLWTFEISEDPSRPIDTMAFQGGLAMSPAEFTPRFVKREKEDFDVNKELSRML